MPKPSHTAQTKPEAPYITWHGYHTTEERETMIREAAYFSYLAHGCCDGHDMEDWLAAESLIDHGTAQPVQALPDHEVQQNSRHGPAADEKLKRAGRQRPRKAIPQVESVEPAEAPDRQ